MAGMLLASGALADAPLGGGPTDRISVSPHEDVLELTWSDTEEKLQGGILPKTPRAGEPLQVSLEVGSFEGAPFNGPLVLTLREAGATHGETVTVKRGERHWEATFTPEHSGPYLLDVSFRTTHTKVLHAALEVGPSLVPRLVGYGLLAALAVGLLIFAVRSVLGEQRPKPPPPEAPEAFVGTAPGAAAPPAPSEPAPTSPPPEGAAPQAPEGAAPQAPVSPEGAAPQAPLPTTGTSSEPSTGGASVETPVGALPAPSEGPLAEAPPSALSEASAEPSIRPSAETSVGAPVESPVGAPAGAPTEGPTAAAPADPPATPSGSATEL